MAAALQYGIPFASNLVPLQMAAMAALHVTTITAIKKTWV